MAAAEAKGEKLTRAAERATELKLPLIFVSGSGGGAAETTRAPDDSRGGSSAPAARKWRRRMITP